MHTVGFQSIVNREELFSVRFFKGSDAACANVSVRFLAVFHVGNLLYVYLESSSRFTVGVADVVPRSLTFPANIAYSGHIKHLRFGLFYIRYAVKTALKISARAFWAENKH